MYYQNACMHFDTYNAMRYDGIRTNNGWMYLSSIMDLYSRKIIAWAFSAKQDVALVIKTLKIALAKRNISRNNKGLILHTDQGSQYTSKKFQEFLNFYNIESSMRVVVIAIKLK